MRPCNVEGPGTPRSTLEHLVFDLSVVSDPDLSPDGTSLLYTATIARWGSNKSDTELRLIEIPSGKGRTLSSDVVCPGRWSLDGRNIAFGARDGEGRHTLTIVRPDGSLDLSIGAHLQELTAVAWARSGDRGAYTTGPKGIDVTRYKAPIHLVHLGYKLDGYGILAANEEAWLFHLAEEHPVRLELPEERSYGFPAWSPDDSLALTSASRRDGTAYVALVRPGSNAGDVELIGPEGGIVSTWCWSPDGQAILLWAAPKGTTYPQPFVYTLGTRYLRSIAPEVPMVPMASPIWIEERSALFTGISAGRSGLYSIDPQTGKVETRFEWDETRVHLSASRDGRILAQDTQSFTAAPEIEIYPADTGRAIARTDHNGTLTGHPTLGSGRIRAGGVDGWLLTPPDLDRARRHPIIVLIHGGPEDAFRPAFNVTQQALVSHGFLVLCPNPRGSIGYGREFADGVLLDWGPGPLEDVLRLLDDVSTRPDVDPSRVGIMGTSYGGYLSAYAIANSNRFSAAVCVSVTFDLTSQYLGADMDFIYGDLAWGGPPLTNPDWYRSNSPSSAANHVKAPTLILHGLADDRCPVGQAEEMFVSLKKFGVEAELVLYPGTAHGLEEAKNPDHTLDYLHRVIRWFSQHL
jgi:dipeptidyl aminopeptidase/acylaminoacyl peptidase